MSAIDDVLGKLHPTFRVREFAAVQGKGIAYARVALHRQKLAGRIVQAKQGWWAKQGVLPLEAASAISYPCYVSFLSALALHGLTTQSSGVVQLAVCRRARKYSAMGEGVQEYKLPKEAFAGFVVDNGVPIAEAEKAFADCLRLPRACPAVVLSESLLKLDGKKIRRHCSKRMLARLAKVEKEAGAEARLGGIG